MLLYAFLPVVFFRNAKQKGHANAWPF